MTKLALMRRIRGSDLRGWRRWSALKWRVLPSGIRGRLFLLIIWALLPALVLQGMIYYQHHVTRRNQAMQTEFEVAQSVATTFATYVEGIRHQLHTIGVSILTFTLTAGADAERLLRSRAARYPAIQDVHWVSTDGTILASSLPGVAGYDLSARPYFRQVIAGQPWALGDLTPSGAIWSNPSVGIAVAIKDETGVLRGVMIATIAPTRLEELTVTLRRRARGTYAIFDHEGTLVYHYPSVPLSWEARSQWRQTDPLLSQAMEGRSALGEMVSAIGEVRSFAARVPIADTGWVAGASRPTDIALAPVWRGLLQDIMLALLATSTAFVFAYLLAQTIAGPLSRLERDAQLMGAGTVDIPADPQAPAEVRSLRSTVAGMATNLISRAEAFRELTMTLETKVAQRTEELEHRARQLEKLTLELSQAEDRERKRLAEVLHDDLQQQLAGAKFHLGLMARHSGVDAFLRKSMARLDQMLKDAIETSRSLSHELSPAVMSQADLNETLEWLASHMREKHGLIVHVQARGEVNSSSEALKIFLYKATQEMLFNAVKHARVKEVTVRVRRRGRYLCLAVSDRGCGFDPQEIKETAGFGRAYASKLESGFLPAKTPIGRSQVRWPGRSVIRAFRVSAPIVSVEQFRCDSPAGFGLLSIRERVQLLGGRMKIHSVKGKGSRFILAVPDEGPVSESEWLSAASQPATAAEPQPEHRLRVLVADDHAIVREGLVSLLSEAPDIEVVAEAENGREAVEQAYELEPDVVIMDVSMPLINGTEATRQIKNHLPETRVVALSMYKDIGTIRKMYKAGAEAYVLKTAPSDELLAAIHGDHSAAPQRTQSDSQT